MVEIKFEIKEVDLKKVLKPYLQHFIIFVIYKYSK